MKKILSLVVAIMISATSFAQLIFVDAEGNEITNGSTITMKDAVYDEDFDEWHVNLDGVSVKNTSSSKQSFTMKVTASKLPSGSFGCCFGMTCNSINQEGRSVELKNLSLEGNSSQLIVNTEWIPVSEAYGTAVVDFEIEGGPTITVNFVYSDPSATMRGDANDDSKITMADIMYIVNYILDSPAEDINIEGADANLDGNITMADIMYVVNYILEGSFPSESR